MAGALIISNTTPLINFAEIGRMDVLQGLFGALVIPPAVRDELEAKPVLFPQAAQVPSLTTNADARRLYAVAKRGPKAEKGIATLSQLPEPTSAGI